MIDHTGATQPRGRMRARTAFAITALLAALTVARGMEFDLVDRYARARPPTTRAPSTINLLGIDSPKPRSARLSTDEYPSHPTPVFFIRRGASSPEGNMKCVQEELKRKTLVMFSYETPDRTHINIRLFDPDGGSIWNNSDTHRGSYAFTTKIEGDHKACFFKSLLPNDPTDMKHHKVRLDWKTGVAVMDYEKIGKGKHVNKVADSLRRLEADLRDTHETMLWLRRKEAELRDLNEATNSRVTWLSIMTLVVCVGLCVWQVMFLNQFFQRKKLL